MVKPNLRDVSELGRGYSIVPISLELFSDIKTPIEVLKNLKSRSDKCYLLESVEGGEKWGRYSFLGFEPRLGVTCQEGLVTVEEDGEREVFKEHPKKVLRRILEEYRSPKVKELPVFTGGFVGYISYEYFQYGESSVTFKSKNTGGFNDLNIMLFDKIIAFDHLQQKIIIIVNVKTDNLEENYREGVLELNKIAQLIKGEKEDNSFNGSLESDFKALFSKEKYCQMVKTVQSYIKEGDIFQAVLANRFEAKFKGDLLGAYRILRTINPSPYMFYLDFGGMQIAGASPETLVALKNNQLTTYPIAGTCKRGATEEEDQALIRALKEDEKELAEHNMLVDLGRNDLGKISEFGSVEVVGYQEVLKLSHVTHLASTVKGQMKQGLDQLDALEAVLPAGTLSGAPKIRAMEIIDELEGEKRGPYGGAIGYLDFSGNMDICIAIRMIVRNEDKVYVAAGAGIVADSSPEKEYQECLNKAQATIETLKRLGEVE